MQLSSSNIRKNSYISRNETLHFSDQDRKIKNPPQEHFLCHRKRKPQKTSNIFSKKAVLIFRKTENLKKNFLYFRK